MRMLSIQSHVTHGHVGNAAIAFPLGLVGVDLLPVHTVLLSAHKGYDTARGLVVPPAMLTRIVDGLAAGGMLAGCAALLSGYLGDAATGHVVHDTARRLKALNPDALYCCDPVIGDVDTGPYVDAAVSRFLLETGIGRADIITPNHYELGLLAGRSLPRADDIAAAARAMRGRGPAWVLVTSARHEATPDDRVEMRLFGPDGAWTIQTPRLDLPVTVKGTGDLVAALFTAGMVGGDGPVRALEAATAVVFAILAETVRQGATELCLVDARHLVAAPPQRFQATILSA